MRSCRSGSRSTNRLEQYRSQTRQPGLQIDHPAAHTTVSVMRAAASHLVNRFLSSTLSRCLDKRRHATNYKGIYLDLLSNKQGASERHEKSTFISRQDEMMLWFW